MQKKPKIKVNLDYLHNPPKKIYWEVVAGYRPSEIQMYDIVFDDIDYKIRGLTKCK